MDGQRASLTYTIEAAAAAKVLDVKVTVGGDTTPLSHPAMLPAPVTLRHTGDLKARWEAL